MTSHLNSHRTTDLNRKCYQVLKPEMELNMINMIYAALPMSEQTEKMTFSCKDDLVQNCMLPTPLCGIFYISNITQMNSGCPVPHIARSGHQRSVGYSM